MNVNSSESVVPLYDDRSYEGLRIGGFIPLSATDLPGKLAAVIFCQGCPWRCRYCHNPHLISTEGGSQYNWRDLLRFLKKRVGLLDAVVFSGGEPTLQPNLYRAMLEVHNLGFSIGLHTAGLYYARLKTLLPLLSWVGFDVKAPFGAYEKITQRLSHDQDRSIAASLQLIIDAKIPLECRTTVHRSLLEEEEILSIATTLSRMGVKKYVVQNFRVQGCDDQDLTREASHRKLSEASLIFMRGLFEEFELR